MADRDTLHWNHLDDFRTWLAGQGWRVVASPPGNGFEVLRARHPDRQHPVIFYSRIASTTDKSAVDVGEHRAPRAQHLTSYGKGSALVRQFLRDRKAKRQTPPATAGARA